jgi:aspartyl-tRNA(Asn)/glutamyl-tRNA(Gln) amidotransferase subunit C
MDIEIEYVAKLARIDLTAEQKKKFSRQLKDILAYIEKLKQLDIKEVEPLSHVLPLQNVFREDRQRPSLAVEKVLENAPLKKEDNFFGVPRVIE